MKILIADDERIQREILRDILTDRGYIIVLAEDGEAAIEAIIQNEFSIVLTDLKMPKKDGLDVLNASLDHDPSIQVIIMTAFGSIPGAVAAIKKGAYDYLAKPFQKEDLLRIVDRALEKYNLIRENTRLQGEVEEKYGYGKLIGKSPSMQEIYGMIDRVKDIDATCLLTGESGTGKELVARAIHYNGRRKNGPFVALNCGAIPDNLIESELFGYKKGAFTGAVNDYAGKFAQAERGTIFLDEIGTMRLDLQVKLLRVLQDRIVTPIGGLEQIPLDVRIIAATNSDLEHEVEIGDFRADLYHRVNVFSIKLPSLRERITDIPILATFFIEKYSSQYDKGKLHLNNDALEVLENYHFPGNIRELENILEKAVILAEGNEITAESISLPVGKNIKNELKADSGLADVEKQMIENALRKNKGSIKKSAIALGTSYKTLQYRIKKFGIKKLNYK